MSTSIIGKRYATGLYKSIGNNVEKAKAISGYLADISKLFEEEKIKKVLISPVMPADMKQEILLSGLEAGSQPALEKFLKVLVKVGRVEVLPEVSSELEAIIKESEGVLEAQLVTAVKVSAEHKEEIKLQLQEKLGRKITLEENVDPNILGGFVVKFGNSVFDMSLKKKLDNFAKSAAV